MVKVWTWYLSCGLSVVLAWLLFFFSTCIRWLGKCDVASARDPKKIDYAVIWAWIARRWFGFFCSGWCNITGSVMRFRMALAKKKKLSVHKWLQSYPLIPVHLPSKLKRYFSWHPRFLLFRRLFSAPFQYDDVMTLIMLCLDMSCLENTMLRIIMRTMPTCYRIVRYFTTSAVFVAPDRSLVHAWFWPPATFCVPLFFYCLQFSFAYTTSRWYVTALRKVFHFYF